MSAIVVYESMYGNTRAVAEAIADGLTAHVPTLVEPVGDLTEEQLADTDLLVVGGPTHTWGMSRPSTRKGAVATAAKANSGLSIEPGAEDPGIREWLADPPQWRGMVAAFDTKIRGRFSGSAARRISRQLRRQQFQMAAEPESFFVSKQNRLETGETARAKLWGEQLGTRASVR